MLRATCVSLFAITLAFPAVARQSAPTVQAPPVGSALFKAEQQKEFDKAMAALDPLIGRWEGPGFVRVAPEQPPTQTQSAWDIRRTFDGRFLRMEFTIRFEDGTRGHWVGYFSFDVEGKQYRSVWTNAATGRQFQETGRFDEKARALALVSKQKRGPEEREIEVDSVFTIVDGDRFRVVDTTRDPAAAGGPYVSLEYSVKRIAR